MIGVRLLAIQFLDNDLRHVLSEGGSLLVRVLCCTVTAAGRVVASQTSIVVIEGLSWVQNLT